MAMVQARRPSAGQAYYQRKLAEGKSPKEALRCLKRRLSDASTDACSPISRTSDPGSMRPEITGFEGQRIDVGEEADHRVGATNCQDRAIGLGGAVEGSSAERKQYIQQRPPAGMGVKPPARLSRPRGRRPQLLPVVPRREQTWAPPSPSHDCDERDRSAGFGRRTYRAAVRSAPPGRALSAGLTQPASLTLIRSGL
jgi:hypothetical protein